MWGEKGYGTRRYGAKGYFSIDLVAALGIAVVILGISVPPLAILSADLTFKKEFERIKFELESLAVKAANSSQPLVFQPDFKISKSLEINLKKEIYFYPQEFVRLRPFK